MLDASTTTLATSMPQQPDRRVAYCEKQNSYPQANRFQYAALMNEQLLGTLVANTSIVLYALDSQGRFTLSEGKALEQLGLQPGEVVGQFFWDVYRDRPAALESVRQCLAGDEVSWVEELNGWIYENSATPLRDRAGQVVGLIGIATDITDRQRAVEQLKYAASHDALTGLPNRTWFLDRLKQAVERANRCCLSDRGSPYQFAVLCLDLDRFKVINESLGHQAGDLFLMAISQRLKDCLRSTDTVARLGGDEFAVLLSDVPDINHVHKVAYRLQQQLKMPVELASHEVSTTVSIGIVLGGNSHLPIGYDNPADVLRDAGIAMDRAQQEGSGISVFDTAMHQQAFSRWQLETDLRRALSGSEELNEDKIFNSQFSILHSSFVLHYQPIVCFATGKISGFEALVRWQHPQRGLVSPAEFIPIAEETGMIISLGEWVLHEACRQLSTWQAQFPSAQKLTMSVNLSCHQLTQPDLIEKVNQILQETGCNPSTLKLEITESCLHENGAGVKLMLDRLKALGVKLCIDDFGTGYSSLSRLHSFPIHTLKVDRSFISKMGVAAGNNEIVRTIVALAHNLGMEVTAEGIETAEQYAMLQQLQCESAQGFLFSKPLDSDAAGALIAGAPHW